MYTINELDKNRNWQHRGFVETKEQLFNFLESHNGTYQILDDDLYLIKNIDCSDEFVKEIQLESLIKSLGSKTKVKGRLIKCFK